jgi:hypothetical protein
MSDIGTTQAQNNGGTFNGWTDKNTGNVYDTTSMTPQQTYALMLNKQGNPNAAAILKGMGLDMNGNPTSVTPTYSTAIANKVSTLTGGSSSGVSSGSTITSPPATSVPTPTQGARYDPGASAGDRLTYFKQNPQAAAQEIAIVKAMYEAEKKNGASQERLDQIHSWANEVRGVSGITDDNVVAGSGYDGVGGSSGLMGGIKSLLDAQKGNLTASQTEEAKAREASLEYLKQFMSGTLEAQKAGLKSDKDLNMTAILKAYQDAIGGQALEMRNADNTLASQTSQINQQNYENSQARNATGAQRGIGNSQQFLGMQQTDAALANTATNAATSDRNNKVFALQQRISSLSTQKDLDVASIDSQYNSAVTAADATSGANLAKAYFDNAQSGIESKSASDAAFNGQAFQALLAGMTTEQQQSFQKELLNMQNQFANENMDKSFNQDVQKMAIQNGYAKELQAASSNAQIAIAKIQQAGKLAEFKAELAAKREDSDAEYEKARARELAKYTEGSPEYAIRSAQLEDAKDANRQELFNKAANDVYVKQVLADDNFTSSQPDPYVNPAKNIVSGNGSASDWLGMLKNSASTLFGGKSIGEKEEANKKQQESYQRYVDLINGNLK